MIGGLPAPTAPQKRDGLLGLFGATMVGVGAMVGAGIFVLCGVAMQHAGPAALVAFGLNGVLSLLTAFSFAELVSAFPESGGSYVFARKVFPIGGAFAAGWVLWFAYVVAAALYALGFGSFLMLTSEHLLGLALPVWFGHLFAVASLAAAAGTLVRGGAGAGNWISFLKLLAFLVLIALGAAVFLGKPAGTVSSQMSPFAPFGLAGVLAAMGFTYIALEGFEVIAAIGEEVRRPSKTIPRAMFLSIGITLVVYISLLFIVLSVGGPPGGAPAWQVLGEEGDAAVAVAALNFGGRAGEAIVLVAGLLATFSVMAAAVLAASRVSFSMARDRALPRALSRLGGRGARTPVTALLVSAGIGVIVVLVTADVEISGAAASLIFLLSFALVNAAGLLVRLRVGAVAEWRAPLYPALPILGIAACLGLAIFQAVMVPAASLVVLFWLLIGAILYAVLFGQRARTVSARAEAWDAELVRLRGRTPLVLVPMASPERAEPLLSVAHALAPPGTGRVHALTVARFDPRHDSAEAGAAAYARAEEVVRKAVAAACSMKKGFEGAVLLAPGITEAIARIAAERHPETVLLGMSHMERPGDVAILEEILSRTTGNVVVLNAPPDWKLEQVTRVLVPVAGKTPHDPLRARLLGTLLRDGARRATLLRVLGAGEDPETARRELHHRAEDLGVAPGSCVVESATDPVEAILRHSGQADLLVLGFGRGGRRRRIIGPFALAVVSGARCPVIALAEARPATLPRLQ